MTEPFSPLTGTQEKRNWTPIFVGLGVVALLIAALLLFTRRGPTQAAPADEYAQALTVSEPRVSQANNFVGATVTYLDLQLTNTGKRTVAAAQAQLTFRNTLNEVVQKETVPLRVLETNKLGGYQDVVDLSMAPLGPGQTRNIRLVFEHLSSDWNRSFPDWRFVNLKYR